MRRASGASEAELVRACAADLEAFRRQAPRADDASLLVLRRAG